MRQGLSRGHSCTTWINCTKNWINCTKLFQCTIWINCTKVFQDLFSLIYMHYTLLVRFCLFQYGTRAALSHFFSICVTGVTKFTQVANMINMVCIDATESRSHNSHQIVLNGEIDGGLKQAKPSFQLWGRLRLRLSPL